VPRPRLHLIRLHGVLAPNAKLRALVVPQAPDDGVKAAPPDMCEASCAHHGPVRLSWARLLKRVFDLDLEHCGPVAWANPQTSSVLGTSSRRHRRSSAMVDHKNRHPSQDCRTRLPIVTGKGLLNALSSPGPVRTQLRLKATTARPKKAKRPEGRFAASRDAARHDRRVITPSADGAL
jgi:hypothetical protein